MSAQVVLTKTQIDIAVEWWCAILHSPKHDSGDARSEALADWVWSPPDPDAVDRFGRELRAILSNEMPIKLTDRFGHVSGLQWRDRDLFVDYHPGIFLGTAAERADLKDDSTTFPCKTRMRFERGGVCVSYGYGAPYRWIIDPEPIEWIVWERKADDRWPEGVINHGRASDWVKFHAAYPDDPDDIKREILRVQAKTWQEAIDQATVVEPRIRRLNGCAVLTGSAAEKEFAR